MGQPTIFDAQRARAELIRALQRGEVGFLAVICSPHDVDQSWGLEVLFAESHDAAAIGNVTSAYVRQTQFTSLADCFSGGDFIDDDRIELVVAEGANMLEVVSQLYWLLPRFSLKVVRLVIGDQQQDIARSLVNSQAELEELARHLRAVQERVEANTPEARQAGFRRQFPAFRLQVRALLEYLDTQLPYGDPIPGVRYDFATDSIEVDYSGLSIREMKEAPIDESGAGAG